MLDDCFVIINDIMWLLVKKLIVLMGCFLFLYPIISLGQSVSVQKSEIIFTEDELQVGINRLIKNANERIKDLNHLIEGAKDNELKSGVPLIVRGVGDIPDVLLRRVIAERDLLKGIGDVSLLSVSEREQIARELDAQLSLIANDLNNLVVILNDFYKNPFVLRKINKADKEDLETAIHASQDQKSLLAIEIKKVREYINSLPCRNAGISGKIPEGALLFKPIFSIFTGRLLHYELYSKNNLKKPVLITGKKGTDIIKNKKDTSYIVSYYDPVERRMSIREVLPVQSTPIPSIPRGYKAPPVIYSYALLAVRSIGKNWYMDITTCSFDAESGEKISCEDATEFIETSSRTEAQKIARDKIRDYEIAESLRQEKESIVDHGDNSFNSDL